MNNKVNKLNSDLDAFLDEENVECDGKKCVIRNDRSLVEVINKKFITEDGRQLIM